MRHPSRHLYRTICWCARRSTRYPGSIIGLSLRTWSRKPSIVATIGVSRSNCKSPSSARSSSSSSASKSISLTSCIGWSSINPYPSSPSIGGELRVGTGGPPIFIHWPAIPVSPASVPSSLLLLLRRMALPTPVKKPPTEFVLPTDARRLWPSPGVNSLPKLVVRRGDCGRTLVPLGDRGGASVLVVLFSFLPSGDAGGRPRSTASIFRLRFSFPDSPTLFFRTTFPKALFIVVRMPGFFSFPLPKDRRFSKPPLVIASISLTLGALRRRRRVPHVAEREMMENVSAAAFHFSIISFAVGPFPSIDGLTIFGKVAASLKCRDCCISTTSSSVILDAPLLK
ncbi:hypothetical protein VC83_06947 [Pseudogymnoascus destructans]|uniref:Uncharacterized protein n=1 Tax=Pseudogymnoascus destructans TaxID=655981 RepID=A0A177A494_9PEZI|nr:uncharacterized protein VC83_06947 [Pseudogymnoascus destructans]OAF56927.1 hypothetical protein VC83_06947 [Pseudogymnoascus destructans]